MSQNFRLSNINKDGNNGCPIWLFNFWKSIMNAFAEEYCLEDINSVSIYFNNPQNRQYLENYFQSKNIPITTFNYPGLSFGLTIPDELVTEYILKYG